MVWLYVNSAGFVIVVCDAFGMLAWLLNLSDFFVRSQYSPSVSHTSGLKLSQHILAKCASSGCIAGVSDIYSYLHWDLLLHRVASSIHCTVWHDLEIHVLKCIFQNILNENSYIYLSSPQQEILHKKSHVKHFCKCALNKCVELCIHDLHNLVKDSYNSFPLNIHCAGSAMCLMATNKHA